MLDNSEYIRCLSVFCSRQGVPSNSLMHFSFLITPKLLPNLTDMEEEAMTILFVMNGPYNFGSPTEWSVDEITGQEVSKRKRQITGEEDDEENAGNLSGSSSSKNSGKKSRRFRD